MTLIFELSMPGRSSWNGRWSGEETCYAIVKNFGTGKKATERASALATIGYWSHSFGDGWRAGVSCKIATPKSAREYRRKTRGFCGYDWMVANILRHGSIQEPTEVAA